MAAIGVTYNFLNGQTSDGPAVSQNFTDITNGLSDGTKDLSVNDVTTAGEHFLADGTTTAPSLAYTAQATHGFYRAASGGTGLTSGTSTFFRITTTQSSGAPGIDLLSPSSGTGDTFVTFRETGGNAWTIGRDDSATGNFVISQSTALGSSNVLSIDSTTGIVNCVSGVRTVLSTANVTAAAPTDAELDSAFGAPATVGAGFMGVLDDNNDETAGFIAFTDGEVWFYTAGVLAL